MSNPQDVRRAFCRVRDAEKRLQALGPTSEERLLAAAQYWASNVGADRSGPFEWPVRTTNRDGKDVIVTMSVQMESVPDDASLEDR